VIVVSNTSPVNYLVLIGEIETLHALFPDIAIPKAVADELLAAGAPIRVRQWISDPPRWLRVEDNGTLHEGLRPFLDRLDEGEARAISLAIRLSAEFLIIDDNAGRQVAETLGLRAIGTLGILDRADARGIVRDLPNALEQLAGCGFRAAPVLRDRLLQRHAARKSAR
jgi:predicted nucleic acid-binding protein